MRGRPTDQVVQIKEKAFFDPSLRDYQDRTGVEARTLESLGPVKIPGAFTQQLHPVGLVRVDLDLDRVSNVGKIRADGQRGKPIVETERVEARDDVEAVCHRV